MSGTGASLNDKIDLAPWGNRPGGHFFTCNECSTSRDQRDSLHFGDSSNTRCIAHALEARQKEVRILDQDFREAEEIVAEAIVEAFDKNCRALFISAIMAGALIVGAIIFGH